MLYEIHKIITSIVIVFLVIFGISKISDIVFKTEENVVKEEVEAELKSEKAEESEVEEDSIEPQIKSIKQKRTVKDEITD